MKKFLFLLFVGAFMIMSQKGNAQDYNTAVGIRFGYPTSLSAKKFLSENNAIEGILGFRSYSFYSYINVSALYLVHKPIVSVEGLKWYFGGGGNLNLFSFKDNFIGDNSSSLGVGIVGALGLDYRFKDLPINVSIDWLPVFSITGYGNGFGADGGALSVRYILGEGKK